VVDAYEYLLLLYAAHEEIHFGTDAHPIREAAEGLRAANPEHVLVRLLDAKARRIGAVRELLEVCLSTTERQSLGSTPQ
jgi:hypothetical protein